MIGGAGKRRKTRGGNGEELGQTLLCKKERVFRPCWAKKLQLVFHLEALVWNRNLFSQKHFMPRTFFQVWASEFLAGAFTPQPRASPGAKGLGNQRLNQVGNLDIL